MARKRLDESEANDLSAAAARRDSGECEMNEACIDADNRSSTDDSDSGRGGGPGLSPTDSNALADVRDFVSDVAGMVSDYAHGVAQALEEQVRDHGWKDALSMNMRTVGYATGLMNYGLELRDVVFSERRDAALAEFVGGVAGGELGGSVGFAVGGPPGAMIGGALGGAGGNWLGEEGYYGLRGLAVTALSYAIEDFQRIGDGRQDEGLPGEFNRMKPIVFDLNRDGRFDLKGAYDQNVRWDLEADGISERVGWVGPTDGLLVFDGDQDGIKYNEVHEITFTLTRPQRLTDLGALAYFDVGNSSGQGRADGTLNYFDFGWRFFDIWRDLRARPKSLVY